ncbi:MAG TPA: hypothetical protein VN892_15140 [Solirubrobacteraceae bacterium]|nr:hypothetical protein [Solirubrobacteraceae bacterium]
MSTVTIPPGVIARVREGAFSALRDCAEGIDQAGRDPGEHEQVRARLRGMWRLLDAIGWTSPDDHSVVGLQVDPGEHAQALLVALDPILALLEGWLADLPEFDPRRPAKQAEVQAVREFTARVRGVGGQR